MTINPFSLKKKELQDFLTMRCSHHHFYYEHPACFEKEYGREPKVGYFDIEVCNLDANFGVMLAYAIKVRGEDKIYHGTITKHDIMKKTLDKSLIKECVENISKFDIVMTYYGTKFDIPYVRSRALFWGLDFPAYGYVKHKDIYYMVRNKLKIHSNKLEVACRFLKIEGKTHIDNMAWILALSGDKESIDYIIDHCKWDVIITEKVHDRISKFVQDTSRSI